MKIDFRPIGIIHTPFAEAANMPIQPAGAIGIKGHIKVFSEYADGLKDLSGFSHIILLYYFHKTKGSQLIVTPYMDSEPRGVFSTRAPARPNPIGISVVKLLKVKGAILSIENVDILDQTPLLDIKPFVTEFDHHRVDRTGWLEKTSGEVQKKRSDHRFAKNVDE